MQFVLYCFNETKRKGDFGKQFRQVEGLYFRGLRWADWWGWRSWDSGTGIAKETGYLEKDIVDVKELPQRGMCHLGILRKESVFFSGRLKSRWYWATEQSLDNGEDVKVVWVDVKDILRLSNDMKTILAVTYFQGRKKLGYLKIKNKKCKMIERG